MLNLVNFLQAQGGGSTGSDLCYELQPVLRVVGIVVFIIKIVVPILLIVVGMVDLMKAVGEKDENKIKDAQNGLIKRAIAAVLVFLVSTLVGVIMGLVGGDDYKACMDCVNHPFSKTKCPNYRIDE